MTSPGQQRPAGSRPQDDRAGDDRGRGLRVLAAGYGFLETPRWHGGRVWVADMLTDRVVAITPDGRVDVEVTVPGSPAGLGFTAAGRLLVLTRDGRLLARDHPDGAEGFVTIAERLAAVAPCHELTVDPAGRVFVGVFGLVGGALLRVDPDGTIERVADGLLLPNGQTLSPDGRTLVVAESAGQRLTAFTISEHGRLVDRRVWARFGPPATATTLPEVLAHVRVWPDGIAADAAGGVWVADPFAGEAFRVDADGATVTDRISTGRFGCYAVALGGPDRRTLALCAAPPGRDDDTRRRARDARLLGCRVAVPAAAR